VSLILAVQDPLRWQPWFYQYLLMLVPYALLKDKKEILRMHQLILAGVYFWSGAHKFGAGFIHFWETFIVRDYAMLQPYGWAIALIECTLALSLLFKTSQRIGAAAIILMHLSLLFILGPLGHNINPVVWPWNLCMIGFCALLFFTPRPLFKKRFPPALWPMLCLVWIMPIFSYINGWPQYLSWHLYSGRGQRLLVFIRPDIVEKVDPKYRSQVKPSKSAEGLFELNFAQWSEDALRVPLPKEDRIYFSLIQDFLETSFDPAEVFIYRDYPMWLNQWGWVNYPSKDFAAFETMPRFNKKK
jgi:hypothetical protein